MNKQWSYVATGVNSLSLAFMCLSQRRKAKIHRQLYPGTTQRQIKVNAGQNMMVDRAITVLITQWRSLDSINYRGIKKKENPLRHVLIDILQGGDPGDYWGIRSRGRGAGMNVAVPSVLWRRIVLDILRRSVSTFSQGADAPFCFRSHLKG